LGNFTKIDKPRKTAVKILYDVNLNGTYANLSLKKMLKLNEFDMRDTQLITQLVYGTLEKQITIDWILNKFLSFETCSPWVQNIFRVSCYQILFLNKIPDSAACNEAVKLCREFGFFGLTGLVNAVLRNLIRKKEEYLPENFKADDTNSLSLYYSFPEWLIKHWVRDYGLPYTKQILSLPKKDESVTIRVNSMRTSSVELKQLLEESKISVKRSFYCENSLKISLHGDIEAQTTYSTGFFTVQNEASILAVDILNPKSGEKVLDACAAPGGKTTYIAEKLFNKGEVTAFDVHQHRVELVEKNARRLGLSNIIAVKQDAGIFNEEYFEKFDKVLIDVPCSGFGVVNKKPDIKNRISPSDIESILVEQRKILETCCRYVKSNGYVVYSTCTINKSENEDMVKNFLTSNPNFAFEKITHYIPEVFKKFVMNDGMIQFLPSRDRLDGFFVALLKRKR